jgi:hypothetical protein
MKTVMDPKIDQRHNLKRSIWFHAFPMGCLIFIIVLLAWISESYQGQNVWSDWVPSHDLTKSNYSEKVQASDLFRTRSNTWSNLAYVLIGLYCFAYAWNDLQSSNQKGRNYLIDTPAMSVLFGAACIYLGIGSGLFHASLTRWGQQLDVGSMYAPLLACIAINIGRYAPVLPNWRFASKSVKSRTATWPLLIVGVITMSYLLYRYKWSMSSAQVLPMHIAIVAAFAIVDCIPLERNVEYRKQPLGWFFLALLSLIVAVLCRQLDVSKQFSSPESWFQGHAIWHLLTSVSLGSLYLAYRCESFSRRCSTF